MNLRQIEVFRAVMTTGSVSDAARLLHVSVPAVSQVLSHTESRLGFPLFERVKGRLHATSEARQLFREVETVYRGVERVGDLVRELSDRRQGSLSVICSPSIGQMVVPEAIAHFRSGHPDVRVHFHSLNYRPLKERLLARQTDLGVSILPVDHPNLHTTPIARSRIVCICPRQHPLAARTSVALADLAPYAMVGYASDTPLGRVIERMCIEQDEVLQRTVEVGTPHNACALVHAGSGIALVDEFSLQGWPAPRFAVVPVVGAPDIVADLVHLRTEPLSPIAQAFVRALRSVLLQRGLALPAAGLA